LLTSLGFALDEPCFAGADLWNFVVCQSRSRNRAAPFGPEKAAPLVRPLPTRPGVPPNGSRHVACSIRCLNGDCKHMVDVRLDTLPQDRPWSRIPVTGFEPFPKSADLSLKRVVPYPPLP
jgi:hypothetical protein